MKNLYPKGKGKIHPSPADGGGPSSPSQDVLAVLKLLPAAILALTVALTYQDKEVLAYLITRSIHGPATLAAGVERRRCRGHRPLFDCGCFDCYISFWSRWDCSPDRELIHQAIEAFEEHLASLEKKAGGRGRRRERRVVDRAEKGKKKNKERRKAVVEEEEEEEKSVEESAMANEAASLSGEVKESSDIVEAAAEENEEEKSAEEEALPVGCERRRGWPDVMGLFNSRLLSLWGPGV
ncbi:uncharacterized protein LOC103996687 [Musa acuminata AAA Group]|uniref:uncharacterized protein LOC103996687 n=1 Tax=Musa acuminata AAA Group TaxID=214697 RepID=UPI0031D6EFC5